LHRLPFTDLKIDRSLIHDVTRSPKAATIVEGIIELAHRLSIRVCAEGIETPEAFAFLSTAKCDDMQGVFIAKPTAASNVEQLASSWDPQSIGTAVAETLAGRPAARTRK
jgi:EAL domain-containing protein (putative c-di-GMP-specific phosphodiesterase class I)